jgi:hypothetical protein
MKVNGKMVCVMEEEYVTSVMVRYTKDIGKKTQHKATAD